MVCSDGSRPGISSSRPAYAARAMEAPKYPRTGLPALPEPGAPCPDLGSLASEHPWLAALATTQEDDGGDVLGHTARVAEALLRDQRFRALDVDDRSELWLAALLHDVGKPATTRYEDGRWTAPGHARRGAIIARRLLWEAGAHPVARERICALVRHPPAPAGLIDSADATRRTIRISLEAGVRRQHLLARADAAARDADALDIDLFAELAGDL